jgi:hypothetical protein
VFYSHFPPIFDVLLVSSQFDFQQYSLDQHQLSSADNRYGLYFCFWFHVSIVVMLSCSVPFCCLICFSCSSFSGNTVLTSISFPVLTRVGILTVFQNAKLSSLTIPSIFMADSIDINMNPVLIEMDVSALQTVSGKFEVDGPILNVLKADSLRNASSIYVYRCVQCNFMSLVDALSTPFFLSCDRTLGAKFTNKKAVVCVPCQPGFYKDNRLNEPCTQCPSGKTSNAEAIECFAIGPSCALVTVPDYGCAGSLVTVTAVPGNGTWSAVNASVAFANNAMGSTTVTSISPGTFSIMWTASSGNCTISKNVTIVGPIIAQIPMPTGLLCGPTGSVNIGADLIGDALLGTWTANFGSFKNSKTGFTLFSWSQSGNVTIQFAPNSVCPTPAILSVDIAAECPPDPLSREATIGVAVGATLGGLVLVVAGVIAAILLYRVWNRRLVQFRDDDVSMPKSEYYKF